jgi:hypothetical protein
MSDSKSHLPVPAEASGARRVFHTVLVIAGWALFGYWWWIVAHQVGRHEVLFTLKFIAGSFVLTVVATGLWVFHNVQIFKRRGPRNKLREATLDYSHDPLGRTVTFEATPKALKDAPVVRVMFAGDTKSYRPMRPNGNGASQR